MATDNAKRSTEHPIDRPPDTDPQQGHEHPEADPRGPRLRQGGEADEPLVANSDDSLPTGGSSSQGR